MKFAISIFAVTLLLIIGYKTVEWNVGYKEKAMITYTDKGIRASKAFGTEGAISSFSASIPEKTSQDIMQLLKPLMMVIITFMLLGAALFVLLSKRFDEPSKRWAFGTIGTILGFWLKG